MFEFPRSQILLEFEGPTKLQISAQMLSMLSLQLRVNKGKENVKLCIAMYKYCLYMERNMHVIETNCICQYTQQQHHERVYTLDLYLLENIIYLSARKRKVHVVVTLTHHLVRACTYSLYTRDRTS